MERCELFDESDLDSALHRFDDLTGRKPELSNAATRAWTRAADAFNRRDLDEFFTVVRAGGRYEDHRKGLRFEGQTESKVVQHVFTAPKGWRLHVEPIALRGSRLALTRARFYDSSEVDEPITTEALTLTEIGDDGTVCLTVHFGADDDNAAFAELEARYLAGEAAGNAVWAEVSQGYAAMNRHEVPMTMSDWETVDHRVRESFGGGG